MSKVKKQPAAEIAQDFFSTEDTFEICFMWAHGLQLHHIEHNQGNKRRCRAFFVVPPSVNLIELKKLWADEPFSRPFKDVLSRYKQFKDELRRFYISEQQQQITQKAVEEAKKIAEDISNSPEM